MRLVFHPDLVRIVSLSTTASDYLCEISSLLDGGYPGDCVTHSCRLAELLLAERKNPWIGRVRDAISRISAIEQG